MGLGGQPEQIWEGLPAREGEAEERRAYREEEHLPRTQRALPEYARMQVLSQEALGGQVKEA